MTQRDPSTDDDLALSALLDDALSDDDARRLRERVAAEPALAERLEELRRVDGAVRGAYGDIANEPVPQRVLDLLAPSPHAERFRPAAVRPAASRWPVAVAAGLALAAGFAIAVFVMPRPQSFGPPGLVAGRGAVALESPLHQVLQQTPSSESRAVGQGWSATPRLTFINLDGDPCRRVDLEGDGASLATLACRRQGAWKVELIGFATPNRTGSGEVYRPATGGAVSAIDDAIDALIDGSPLGREAEAEWTRQNLRETPSDTD